MKKYASLIFGSLLVFGISACDVARTSSEAPDSMSDTAEDVGTREESLEDSNSEVRQAQLNSDIRAREQRNEVLGDEEVRMDSDLESEVRSKLEANIPRAKLTIEAEDGKVFIVGTVPDQKEFDTIEPLAKEIKGVKEVEMDVKVVP
ncbi:MAG: BON domain-containing protein [Cyanobacteriota bacterium]|nr:BON domain-containing protein [Cyanobacteriota bacterium]